MVKKIFIYYLPPFIWAIIIFILSSIAGHDYPAPFFNYSYLAHFVEFFILSFLILRAFCPSPKNIYLSLIIAALYALSDEVHQIFVAERSISLMDWLIDFLGVVAGLKVYLVNSKLQTK